MGSWSTRVMTRRATAAFAAFAAAATFSTVLAADAPIKDAKFGAYTRYGHNKINIRFDKIGHVAHIDGRPYTYSQDPEATTGYNIYDFTVQNAGPAISMHEPAITAVYDDQSQLEGTYGPYVGTGIAHFAGQLEHLQTVHFRVIQWRAPADHKITKVIVDPGEGGTKLRYNVTDANVEQLPDVPRAAAH